MYSILATTAFDDLSVNRYYTTEGELHASYFDDQRIVSVFYVKMSKIAVS